MAAKTIPNPFLNAERKSSTEQFRDTLVDELTEASAASQIIHNILLRRRRFQFEAKGGCLRCGGFGRVLTWSTLDGACYNEYGNCPDLKCNTATRTISGTCAGFDHADACLPTPELAETDVERATVLEAANRVKQVERDLAAIEALISRPSQRSVIRVVRGRKVPIGTTGEVLKTIYSNLSKSYRVFLRDQDGTTNWTDARNVEMIAEPLS